MEEEFENSWKCKKCNGTGVVKDERGIHVCYDCLVEGRLDVHSKNVPDSKVQI